MTREHDKPARVFFEIPAKKGKSLSRAERAILSVLRKNLNDDRVLDVKEIAERARCSVDRAYTVLQSIRTSIDEDAAALLNKSKLQRIKKLQQKAEEGHIAALKLSFEVDGTLQNQPFIQQNIINLTQMRKNYETGLSTDMLNLNRIQPDEISELNDAMTTIPDAPVCLKNGSSRKDEE